MFKIIYDGKNVIVKEFPAEVEGGIAFIKARGKYIPIEVDVIAQTVKSHKIDCDGFKMVIPRVKSLEVYTEECALVSFWTDSLEEEFDSRNHDILQKACKVIMMGE